MDSTQQSRPSWRQFFMDTAVQISHRSTCKRAKVGCVIVGVDNRIVSTGYVGSIAGEPHCLETECLLGEDGGCVRTVHAEQNALLFADRFLLRGATLYTTLSPCLTCHKMAAQAGISTVVYKELYRKGLPRIIPAWMSYQSA